MATPNWDISLADVIMMKRGKKKAIQLATYGLLADGADHKQWYLERILEALKIDLGELSDEMHEHGYDWDDGIAP